MTNEHWIIVCTSCTALLMAAGWLMAREQLRIEQLYVLWWKESAERAIDAVPMNIAERFCDKPTSSGTSGLEISQESVEHVMKTIDAVCQRPEPEPPVRDPRQNPIAGDGVRFGDGEEWHVRENGHDRIVVQGPTPPDFPDGTKNKFRPTLTILSLADWRLNVAETTVIMKSGKFVNEGGPVPYKIN